MNDAPDLLPPRLPGPGEIKCHRCGDIALSRDARWRWLPGHIVMLDVCGGCAVVLDEEAAERLRASCGAWEAMSEKDRKK